MDNVTTDDMIESLIVITHGASDQHTQHLFRQSLRVLVELAKIEERVEINMDMPGESRLAHRGTVH